LDIFIQIIAIAFSGDIFKEKATRTDTVTASKHATPASSDIADIFDDPLNASDV